jgi:hypothetical protein
MTEIRNSKLLILATDYWLVDSLIPLAHFNHSLPYPLAF